jgi:hypothetical protein
LQGNPSSELHSYPLDEYFYYLCAKEFGWTPQEADEQPAEMVDWIIKIFGIVREIENDREQYS